MRIHFIEHENFEGPANIELWAKNKGHSITRTKLFNGDKFPFLREFDWLVIMGGSMNVYEDEKFPWLPPEKEFIKQAIDNNKIVLGICLGAQLIAAVLGGKVSKNEFNEIGWFPVKLTGEAKNSPVFSSFPDEFTVVHWHGDTFSIPPGARRIAESQACANQAFEIGRVIGLQFHLEYSRESIDLMFKNCASDFVDGRYIQKPDEILSGIGNVNETRRLLGLLLDNMESEFFVS